MLLLVKAMRGLLGERGLTISRSPEAFKRAIPELLGKSADELTSFCQTLLTEMLQHLHAIEERAETVLLPYKGMASVVLELVVRDQGAVTRAGRPTATQSDKGSGVPLAREAEAPRTLEVPGAQTIKDGDKPGVQARGCDSLLLSQVGDLAREKELRCIQLVVPKDQVAGYTPSGKRSYTGDYTQYIKGPARAPLMVKMIEGDPVQPRKVD